MFILVIDPFLEYYTMKHKLLLPLVIAFTFSCSSVKVNIDTDKDADFSQYTSASFLGWQDNINEIMNDFDKKRLREAFEAELEKRNIERVDKDGDMAITLYIVKDQKTSVTAYSNYYGGGGYGRGRYRRGGYGWGGGSSHTTYSETDYVQGTLVMDVFDNKSGDMIWQAVATGTVNEKPEKREKSIPKTVASVMKKFPIPVSK